MAIEIDGLDELNAQLRRVARVSPEAVERGAYAGVLLIQRHAQKNVPVEFGNLRGSAYSQRIPRGAETGFTSSYALFVHENMEQKLRGQPRPSGLGTYWNPGGPKFLERAVNENMQEIVDLTQAYLEQAIGL